MIKMMCSHFSVTSHPRSQCTTKLAPSVMFREAPNLNGKNVTHSELVWVQLACIICMLAHLESKSLCLANIQRMLLLRAGDVERNPGPAIPTMQDLSIIPFTASKWYDLGQVLGLKVHTLAQIANDNSNMTRCKRAMFKVWLKETAHPSWSAIVNALRTIGENVVAVEVEREYLKEVESLTATSSPGISILEAKNSEENRNGSLVRKVR